MGWDHGYYSSDYYTIGYYREMAPNWLDFAALVKGHRPPRSVEGEPFSYLDLGCGMGFGLCILAALYPEGEFTGVDFLPDHIAHGQWLARRLGLANITFLEADFLDLQRDPSPLRPAAAGATTPGGVAQFHYVAAHGIATWVIEPVQRALFAVAAAALRPGGLFYCSYNTYPGWLPLQAFHQLVKVERQQGAGTAAKAALKRASERMLALVGPAEDPAALGLALPTLRAEMEKAPRRDQRYLSQEYANDGWQPLYVADMHQRLMAHKLRPLASATLPELFDDLLPAPLQAVVKAEQDPLVRETLLDLGSNKAFRRDIFVNGQLHLNLAQRHQALGRLLLTLQAAPPMDNYTFTTSFGTLTASHASCAGMEARLTEAGPCSLEDLATSTNMPPEEAIRVVTLLLHANRIGLHRGAACEAARASCQPFNAAVIELMLEGAQLANLASPLLGNAVSFTTIQAMLTQGLEQGMEGELLAVCVQAGLAAMGAADIKDAKGQLLEDPAAQLEAFQKLAADLQTTGLPMLRRLGVLA
ncbi:methyltransferase regulatory domain-containing protein [Synechococcus sp. Lug-A]|uniref:class I SAM-dependent methyltransferase n=1 Tax=Synechococcus sp. Lug-A TaxID=2823740 RepID=UPI0020CD0325|nr:methyltransferase regulatory domain-containing protein [Synechococcus sp. Lug-A]MCP9846304.1 methyltransferase regulatory domain-containing protein [Synechococcus sp. Lug-A]